MLEWDDSLSVGNKEIDEQHKYLISLINKLRILVDENKQDDKIINELLNYAKLHFLTEEKYFLKYKYEDTHKHIKEHNAFVDYIFDKTKKLNMIELLIFLDGWLISHIKNSDIKYKHIFNI